MKHLFAFTLAISSLCCLAQWPTLPYNPDDNADGLIGVADLQALLANYGNEFASAVVSEDGESAIVHQGNMPYLQCKYSCDQLPGFWRLPNMVDLVPVWSEVYNSSGPFTWLNSGENGFSMFRGHETSSSSTYISSPSVSFAVEQNMRCYCVAEQLPRVEYTTCTSTDNNAFLTCCEARVAEGWMPLSGSNPVSAGGDFKTWSQAFWRWAE